MEFLPKNRSGNLITSGLEQTRRLEGLSAQSAWRFDEEPQPIGQRFQSSVIHGPFALRHWNGQKQAFHALKHPRPGTDGTDPLKPATVSPRCGPSLCRTLGVQRKRCPNCLCAVQIDCWERRFIENTQFPQDTKTSRATPITFTPWSAAPTFRSESDIRVMIQME
jgi:hypothetical protein